MKSFHEILQALINISNDQNEKPITHQESKGLEKKLVKIENVFYWSFGRKFWKVNKSLQSKTIDIVSITILSDSLKNYVQSFKENGSRKFNWNRQMSLGNVNIFWWNV